MPETNTVMRLVRGKHSGRPSVRGHHITEHRDMQECTYIHDGSFAQSNIFRQRLKSHTETVALYS